MNLETFDDVRKSIARNKSRRFNLLLGNGFSVAYDAQIFSYNALHDFVVKQDDADLTRILQVVETRNFEVIMQYLDSFSALLEAFGNYPKLKNRVDLASRKLKTSLLDAVSELHPEHVFEIPEEQSSSCAKFIETFLKTNGCIFSTNYDLLLYWVLMRNAMADHGDGCGRVLLNDTGEPMATEDQEWSDLIWGKNKSSQNVFYLHGALQFFDKGVDIIKEEYSEYEYLLHKISARMDAGDYPVFVAAGDGAQKLAHIRHNQYLTYCYDQLCETQGSIVSFGFSFGPYDEHIIEALNKAASRDPAHKLWSVYIGVYSDSDKEHIEDIAYKFRSKLHVFDAKTVDPWNDYKT